MVNAREVVHVHLPLDKSHIVFTLAEATHLDSEGGRGSRLMEKITIGRVSLLLTDHVVHLTHPD